MIIVTLTKLFVIRMVARVRSESSLSIRIFLSLVLSGLSSDKSFGDKLKNAISAPLAKPETKSKTIADIRHIIASMPGAINCICDNGSSIRIVDLV